MERFDLIKQFNLLILLCLFLAPLSLAEEGKTPFMLGWTGEEAIIEDTLLKEAPNVIMLYEFACDNNCSALYKLFRKVLSQSKLKVGEDIKVISLGLGAKDDWQLARQRALKAFERFSQKADIEKNWVFGVVDERANPFLATLGDGLIAKTKVDIPRVVVLSPKGKVSSVFTIENLSTENFIKAVSNSKFDRIYERSSLSKEICPGGDTKIRENSIGIKIMRIGLIASLLMFTGIVLILIRNKS